MKIEQTGKSAIETYLYRYPQLTLPVGEGMSESKRYKDIVLRGKLPREHINPFNGTEEDCIYLIPTPVGDAEVLYLADRQDFEKFVQILGYKCEEEVIPASMGAIHIGGVNNWRKIQIHKAEMDEIIADCMGIYRAFGVYDITLAKKLLGVEGTAYRQGGRLENYIPYLSETTFQKAEEAIERIAAVTEENSKIEFWALLDKLQTALQ